MGERACVVGQFSRLHGPASDVGGGGGLDGERDVIIDKRSG